MIKSIPFSSGDKVKIARFFKLMSYLLKGPDFKVPGFPDAGSCMGITCAYHLVKALNFLPPIEIC
jgi:hypothetical protein